MQSFSQLSRKSRTGLAVFTRKHEILWLLANDARCQQVEYFLRHLSSLRTSQTDLGGGTKDPEGWKNREHKFPADGKIGSYE